MQDNYEEIKMHTFKIIKDIDIRNLQVYIVIITYFVRSVFICKI